MMDKSSTQPSLKLLQGNEGEWNESADELSFDDVSCLVCKALNAKYSDQGEGSDTGGYMGGMDCPYWVYKLWNDKVVAKRSYSADSTNPLFQLYSYSIKKDDNGNYYAELGDPTEVVQMFVPVGSEPSNGLMAVREADKLSTDDPIFVATIMDEEEEGKEVEDPTVKIALEAGLIDPIELKLKESEMRIREAGNFDSDFFDCPLTEAKIDVITEGSTKRYVMRNVAMLSEESKNGRKYGGKVQEDALPIFEGIKAYADHPTKANENEPRRIKEAIGRYKNVRYDANSVKTFGDLHLAPTKLVTEYIIPIAQSDPTLIGSSINVYGRMDSKGNVEKITKGNSVDLVTEPATTKSLYEAAIEVTETKEKGEKKMILDDVLKDEGIMKQLREHFEEELSVIASVEQKDDQLKEQDSKIKALEEEIAKMKLVESTRATQAEIETILSESKLPDEAKKELRPLLEKAGSSEERKGLIGRMEVVFESVSKTAPAKPAPSVHSPKEVGKSQLNDGDMHKRVFESFQARR